MENSVVVAAALLSVCSGGLSEASTVHRTVALEGQTAVLPCTFTFTGTERLTIEWTKDEESPSPKFVYLFRSGREEDDMRDPEFLYRTNLFHGKLRKGNASLRISDVSLFDAGKYKCKTFQDLTPKESEVELFVGAVSDPKFLQVSITSEGVSLRCEATCWFPEPQMTLLDEQGKVINAENPTTERRNGCFTVTAMSTVPTGGRFICRVHQPERNLMRETEINIPTESRVGLVKSSSSCSIPIAVAVLLLVAVIIIIIICVVFRRRLAQCVSRQRRRSWCPCSGQNSEGQNCKNDLKYEDDNRENEGLEQTKLNEGAGVQSKTPVSGQSHHRSVPVVSNSSDGPPLQPERENGSRPDPLNVLLCPKCFSYLPDLQKTEATAPMRRLKSAPGKMAFSTTLKRQTGLPAHDLDTETSLLLRIGDDDDDDDDNIRKTK